MSGDLVFYGFALLTVLSGFFVVASRNVVHAAFSLLFTLFGVAGLYAQLGADFLAVTQTVVYIGGILVLVIFAVMMTRIPRSDAPRRGLDRAVPAAILSLLAFALVYMVIVGTRWPERATGAPEATVAEIGTGLMTTFVFPFEYASLVLLAAMVGAAILIRERAPQDDDDAGTEVQP